MNRHRKLPARRAARRMTGLAAIAVACWSVFVWAGQPPATSAEPAGPSNPRAKAQDRANEATRQPEKTPEPAAPKANADEANGGEIGEEEVKPIELSKKLKKLGDSLYIDEKQKWVVIDGEVVLRKGPPLEMFACLKNTKEHESIVAVPVKALHVHAALIAVGARQGKPVRFEPEYRPATGQEIEVRVLWTDAKGKGQQARAQDWVREVKTKKAMTHPFVFAGSMFWTDEETGQKYYMAEGGELICVSNFGSALLDLPVPSSQSTDGLLFEAFTERIPEEGTRVQLVLMPKKGPAAKEAKPEKAPAKASEAPAEKKAAQDE